MNPIEQLIRGFQDLVAQVPELVQPLVVMLAGAVPFIEGEIAAMVGVIGGINPIEFKRWLVRFGVPGASILGPLAIPTQFTSAILVAGGTPRGWVLLWQAVAITLWTTIGTVSLWAALTFLVGI